jgi:hypothetical protein
MDDWQKVAKSNQNLEAIAWDDESLHPDSAHYCIWVLTHHDIAMAEVIHQEKIIFD